MALSAGRRLGPYEILEPVGSGGMGEVYRAKDTRLDRIVAIKVLAAHLSIRPDLRERFEREARAVSALKHANICVLYDVGHDQGDDFLVLEFLEGESLAARLDKGPLPLYLVLRYAIEIAGALDSAHRQGVVHRDLKPGNVMITPDGAKLLDFGLAKLKRRTGTTGPEAAVDAHSVPTLAGNSPVTGALTGTGTILGTLQYMSPEQLQGSEPDARADIFAFGVM